MISRSIAESVRILIEISVKHCNGHGHTSEAIFNERQIECINSQESY